MKSMAGKIYIVSAFIFVISVCTLLLFRENFLVNYSPSISPGIYIRSQNHNTGQFAHFPIPPSALTFLRNRGSVIPTRGFLKPTLAFPPYRLCYDPKTLVFTVENKILPSSELPPLVPIKSGCHQEDKGVFVYSSRVKNSLDSRHYGSIELNKIDFFEPFFTIKND